MLRARVRRVPCARTNEVRVFSCPRDTVVVVYQTIYVRLNNCTFFKENVYLNLFLICVEPACLNLPLGLVWLHSKFEYVRQDVFF